MDEANSKAFGATPTTHDLRESAARRRRDFYSPMLTVIDSNTQSRASLPHLDPRISLRTSLSGNHLWVTDRASVDGMRRNPPMPLANRAASRANAHSSRPRQTQSVLDSLLAAAYRRADDIVPTARRTLRGTQPVATTRQNARHLAYFRLCSRWRRERTPKLAPHAAEIPYLFDTLSATVAQASA